MTVTSTLVSLVAAAGVLGACKTGDDSMKRMAGFRDQMCACADLKEGADKCAKKVTDEMTKWSSQNAGNADPATKPTDEQVAIGMKLAECTTKVMMATAMTAPPASDGSPTAPAQAPHVPDPPPPPEGGALPTIDHVATITSTEDYNEIRGLLLRDLASTLARDGCDSIAGALGRYVHDLENYWIATDAWGKTHESDRNTFDTRHADVIKRTANRSIQLIAQCKDNAAFQAAFAKLP